MEIPGRYSTSCKSKKAGTGSSARIAGKNMAESFGNRNFWPSGTAGVFGVPPEPTHLSFSRDIVHCHPYLRIRWPELLRLYQEKTGNDLIITCTWRSVREQQRLFRQGRVADGPIVTNIDGRDRKSNHNIYPARALDVAVNRNTDEKKVRITWEVEYYEPLLDICKSLDLVSGGSWQNFLDWPHAEITQGIE